MNSTYTERASMYDIKLDKMVVKVCALSYTCAASHLPTMQSFMWFIRSCVINCVSNSRCRLWFIRFIPHKSCFVKTMTFTTHITSHNAPTVSPVSILQSMPISDRTLSTSNFKILYDQVRKIFLRLIFDYTVESSI